MERPIQPSSLGLTRIELLQGLGTQRLDEVCRQCTWRRFEPGQLLIAQDAADRDVYLVVAGTVRVTSYSPGGRETSFHELSTGSSFGEVSALDGRPRSADVVALSSGLLASLSPDAFRALLRAEWSVNERVLCRLTGLVRELTDRVLDVSNLNVHQRVCRELLRLARANGAAGNHARIEPAPKHADLASVLSTYREQVTRELSSLARLGVVTREAGALVIGDLAALERYAEAPAGKD
jgi:CRP-like cAMP-binding protein